MLGEGRMATTDQQSKIVDAALDQVRESGLASLSVRTVAARAHYSPAGLYRHFESIEELHHAVALRVCGEFKAHLWARLTEEPSPSAAARAAAEWVDANPQVSEFILQCSADRFMKAGDDKTWFSFSSSSADDEQKMRVAIVGWDILRSLLHVRSLSTSGRAGTPADFDFEGLFEATSEFLRSAQADGLI